MMRFYLIVWKENDEAKSKCDEEAEVRGQKFGKILRNGGKHLKQITFL
jgi:hypothetical protein